MRSLEDLDRDVKSLEEKVETLYGEHVHLIGGIVTPTGEYIEAPQAEIVGAEGPPPGQSVSEWISGLFGSPGFVVDMEAAMRGPCLRIQLGEGRRPLVYHTGIVGALDDDQKERFCQAGYKDRDLTPKQRERIATMEVAAKKCSAETTGEPGRERIQGYFTCLAKELKSKGQEAW
jgi:hypothetical protein